MRKVFALVLLGTLAACGVKGHLDKPEGARYVRTYPAS